MIKFKVPVLITWFVLIVSTLRGIIIVLSGQAPSREFFFLLTIINIVFIVYYSRFFYFLKNPLGINKYLNLFIINFIIGLVWLGIHLLMGGSFIESIRAFFIFFITPLSVLLFIQVKEYHLVIAVYFTAIIVSLSCIADFTICNIYPGGVIGPAIKKMYLDTLTPEGNELVMSRVHLYFRAHGITGSYHDSANILTMASVFIVGYMSYHKSILLKTFSVLSIIIIVTGLITTLSVANIIAAFIGIVFINFHSLHGLLKRLLPLIILAIVILGFFVNEFNLYEVIAPDLDPSGQKMQDMMSLGDSSLLNNFTSILIGHEDVTGISNLGFASEASIIGLLVNFGIITFISLMYLLSFPIYIYYISTKEIRKEIWVPTMTVFIGVLTLWHYGSLFRSTSIFLFYVFYALVIKGYMKRNLNCKPVLSNQIDKFPTI